MFCIINRALWMRNAAANFPFHRRRRVCFEQLETREVYAAGIEITGLPQYGVDGFLTGRVQGISPAQYGDLRVTAYIQIEGAGWWIKPTATNPVVPINNDGTFSIDVATGGIDNRATIFYAALVPANVTPPVALGTSRVPASLQPLAIAIREQYSRTINFSGYTWGVKESPAPVGPGFNTFSNQAGDAFVDSQGLHLGVTFHDGKWWSTEVILLGHLGYGTYSFETKSHLESLDKNITFGGFTYDSYGDDESIPTGPFREIDVEASRWGNAADPTNAQFVVQPFGVNGNLHRYTIEDHTNVPTLTHYLDWTPDHIEFATLNGTQDANSFPTTSIVDRLLYVNDPLQNHFIPTSSREKFRFNTWINSGGAPSDGNPVQIVIPKFQFQPSIAPIIAGPLTAIIPHSGIFAFDPSKIIAVSDKDAGISSETVSLSVTAGLLEMNTNAVSVIGGASGTKDITIRGTLDKLNASLATLKFIAPNSGSSSTLTVSANDGTLQSNVLNVAIDLTNIAPTLDAIPDPLPILEDSGPTQIVLTGISAGGNESQKLVLKADSSNPTLIPTPIVVYVSPNSAGVVSYSPLASQSGTVTIAVTVMDDGGTQAGGADRLVRTFTQRVIPVNDAPSFHKGCPNVCRAESPLGDGLAFA